MQKELSIADIAALKQTAEEMVAYYQSQQMWGTKDQQLYLAKYQADAELLAKLYFNIYEGTLMELKATK